MIEHITHSCICFHSHQFDHFKLYTSIDRERETENCVGHARDLFKLILTFLIVVIKEIYSPTTIHDTNKHFGRQDGAFPQCHGIDMNHPIKHIYGLMFHTC